MTNPFDSNFNFYKALQVAKFDLSSSLYDKSLHFNRILKSFVNSGNAIEFEGSSQLKDRINDSLLIIDQLLSSYDINEEISISFNGGKDCMVMLILFISRLASKIPYDNQFWKNNKLNSALINYEQQFPDVVSFIEQSCTDYNLDLVVLNDTLKSGFQHYLDKMPKIKTIVIGTRETDPFSKDLKPFQATDNDWPKFQRVHPILTWNYYEIWAFLKIFQIPYCSLYDLGYTSIGGVDTTIPNPELKIEGIDEKYLPAYFLKDGSTERDGRIGKTK